MVWDAAFRVEVAKVATPVPSSVEVPNSVAPSRKSTVPVGVPEPPVTVAVKVTDSPNTVGVFDVLTVVVEAVVPGGGGKAILLTKAFAQVPAQLDWNGCRVGKSGDDVSPVM